MGGGPAGTEAAAEAARNGAEVTLLEGSESPLPAKSLWPELIGSPKLYRSDSHPAPRISSVDVIYGRPAISVGPSSSVVTSEGRSNFDSVVIATGKKALFRAFPGFRKPGVYVLDGLSKYIELGRRRASIDRAVVYGQGLPAMQVAERLCREGRRVTFLSSGGMLEKGLSPEINRILKERIVETGVSFVEARLDRAVGIDSVEAVVAGGRVIPCDTVAVVPGRVPNFPPGSMRIGPRGGILVDSNLRSTSRDCFAAGGCAELPIHGRARTILLCQSAPASGRTAGANASGQNLVLKAVGSFAATVFGLGLVGAGLGLKEARDIGLEVVETARRWGPTTACSIIHDRLTGRVVGVQAVGVSAESSSASLSFIVSHSLNLRTMAYADVGGSTDISLVAETARQGIHWGERAVGQGSDLRPA